MRGGYGVLALTLVALPAAAAEVNVRVVDGRVDLAATAAPVAEVLERLARQTGMKVIYEGPQPRQLVSLSLSRRTPAEAVVGLLEGLGVNYMLFGDPTGVGVQTLMIAGVAVPVVTPEPTSSRPQPFRMPVASGPEPDNPIEEPGEEELEPFPVRQPPIPTFPPGAAGLPGAGGLPGTTGFPGPNPNPGGVNPGASPAQATPPGVPIPGFPGGAVPNVPVSPYTPTPFGTRPVFPPTPQPETQAPTPAPGQEAKPDSAP